MKRSAKWYTGQLLALVLFLYGRGLADEPKRDSPMWIVPRTKAIAIDGSLADWNREGKIGPVWFDEDAKDEYNGTFYAMYDRENLYLAAEIVEPHPPYNTFPARGIGDWNGDAVVIRMSSNPALPFPLIVPDEATSTDLFTASFWWNHLKKEPFFCSYHGMRGEMQGREKMAGVRLAVKTATNGKGYTVETQVPWRVVNPGFRPQPGNQIAFTWEVSVANDSPAQPARVFQLFANGGGASGFRDPASWGKAVFK